MTKTRYLEKPRATLLRGIPHFDTDGAHVSNGSDCVACFGSLGEKEREQTAAEERKEIKMKEKVHCP